MINPVQLGMIPTGAAEAPVKKEDIAGAARQFESLLLTQILRSVRESGGGEDGWLGSGSDAGSETAMAMAEEQFAAALSAQGGFGLARMVTDNLKPDDSKAPGMSEPAGHSTNQRTVKNPS